MQKYANKICKNIRVYVFANGACICTPYRDFQVAVKLLTRMVTVLAVRSAGVASRAGPGPRLRGVLSEEQRCADSDSTP